MVGSYSEAGRRRGRNTGYQDKPGLEEMAGTRVGALSWMLPIGHRVREEVGKTGAARGLW